MTMNINSDNDMAAPDTNSQNARGEPEIVDRVPQTAAERALAFTRDLIVTVLFWVALGILWVPFQISLMVDRVRDSGSNSDN